MLEIMSIKSMDDGIHIVNISGQEVIGGTGNMGGEKVSGDISQIQDWDS